MLTCLPFLDIASVGQLQCAFFNSAKCGTTSYREALSGLVLLESDSSAEPTGKQVCSGDRYKCFTEAHVPLLKIHWVYLPGLHHCQDLKLHVIVVHFTTSHLIEGTQLAELWALV